jgi:hypothetical protein
MLCKITSKLSQYATSVFGGLIIAFETSILFFIPCFIITLVDVWSAYCLGKRVHKKYPEKADGKFKSEYKFKILYTMIIAFLAIILASYVDTHVIKDLDVSVRFTLGAFFIYQLFSIAENWSSENDNKLAIVFQRVLVNKAERHLNVPEGTIGDVLLKKNEKRKVKSEERKVKSEKRKMKNEKRKVKSEKRRVKSEK